MCENCEWLTYLDLCNDMLLDESYAYATATIEGIRNWIEVKEHITDKQKIAIDNIYNSIEGE